MPLYIAAVPLWGRIVIIGLFVGLLFLTEGPKLDLALFIHFSGFFIPEMAHQQIPLLQTSVWDHLHTHPALGSVLLWIVLFHWDGKSHPCFHRWLGRFNFLLTLLMLLAGFVLIWYFPFGGVAEMVTIFVFGGLLLVEMAMMVVAIVYKKDPEAHGIWALRAFAILIGAMTVRILFIPMAQVIPERTAIWVGYWVGWLLTIGVFEWWIHCYRKARILSPAH